MMKRLLYPIFALALLGLGSTAIAKVTVYENGFGSKSQVEALNKLASGKACKKSWKGEDSLGFTVTKAPVVCALRTPVEGDAKQPDHTVEVTAKLLKSTDKKVRKDAYVGLAVRAKRGEGYEVRIFPKGRRWKLLRNDDSVRRGRSKAIDALGKKNVLRLAVEGNIVVARVNDEALTDAFKDRLPEEVGGRKTALTFGVEGKSRKDAVGLFDDLSVAVPDP